MVSTSSKCNWDATCTPVEQRIDTMVIPWLKSVEQPLHTKKLRPSGGTNQNTTFNLCFPILQRLLKCASLPWISGGTQTTQTFTKTHQWTLVLLRVPQYCVDAKSRQTRFGRRNQESARYYRTYHFFHNLFHILQQENLCLKDGQSRMVNWEMESR